MSKKFPSFSQWKQIFKVLKKTERLFFLSFAILAFASAIYFIIGFYINSTQLVPAYGGAYTEGVVGQPRFINPIYGETNDVDRTLIDLIYSGLMSYDKEGKIINDLTEKYQISDDGKTYTFELKKNLFWQDGVPLTVDDVIYTIKTIQNSDYKSPLRATWLDVAIQKISENSFALSLGSPYNSFLESCTLKIMPQHIWKNIPPENFALSAFNLQPIGSGPYIISNLQQTNTGFVKSISLKINYKYYGKTPYISNLYFKFFSNKEDLIKSANQKTIDGFSISALSENQALAEKQVKPGWTAKEKYNIYSFSMPRYFAVFFNPQNSDALSDANITQALNYSVDKQNLTQKINEKFKAKVSIINSPILPNYFGYSEPTTSYDFNTETANNLLDKSGYKIQNKENQEITRMKANDKKPAFQFKSYLKQGSKGNEVIELQGCLTRLDENFKNLLSQETNGTYSKGTEKAIYEFQKKYLPEATPTGETGPGTRKKLNELCFLQQDNLIPLQLTLTTINQPQMVETANILKDFWQKVGFSINIKIVELSEIKDIIKTRNYEALLYGQALGSLPDPYPFWHSTQVNDPGLNLSTYKNKKTDQLLKDAREALNEEIKTDNYESLQEVILADTPALFLYNTDYIYWVSEKIKGIDTIKIIDPSKRFENINNWYIKTKRTWK